MDGLTKRNFEALAQGLKDARAKASEQEKRIESLSRQLAMLESRISASEARINVVFAKAMGNGATA